MGGAGAWVLLGVRWVLRAWVLLARIKQVNGAMVAAVVGEPFHGVKCEIKKITRNMKNGTVSPNMISISRTPLSRLIIRPLIPRESSYLQQSKLLFYFTVVAYT